MIDFQRAARAIALRALKLTACDICIAHHWVPERRIKLNSFKHKGYWYHGRHREYDTMKTIGRLVKSADTVIEIGAHIGYLTIWFQHLAGDAGRIVAFEPSYENRKYLEHNIDNLRIEIEDFAVSDYIGNADFFVEDLTGQNNSLIENYDVLSENCNHSGIAPTITRRRVQVTTLDAWCEAAIASPDFIKIDVEGAELSVLHGAESIISKSRPIIMVEITHHHAEVFNFMKKLKYNPFDEKLNPARINFDGTPNYFWIPEEQNSY